MSEDFLKNPLSLFDVKRQDRRSSPAHPVRSARSPAKVLAGAGANVVICGRTTPTS